MIKNILLRTQLELICENFRIESQYVFSLGAFRYVLPTHAKKHENNSPATKKKSFCDLIERVTSQLYEDCYMQSFLDSELTLEENIVNKVNEDNLTSLFHAANDNKDGWDPGWQVYKAGFDGQLFVQKGDRSRAVIAGEYSTYKWPGVAPVAGDFVSVRMFSGSTDVQPSFFFAFGRTLSDQFDEYAVVRFYFNISSNCAPKLMSELTESLNRFQIPFKFKALVMAKMYTRTDAAVLYVARRYYPIVANIIIDLQREKLISLRNHIPLFTKELIKGVGVAEDPKLGTSFGMHRCNLMAQGLVDAWHLGTQNISDQMLAIETVFLSNQINLDCPYLNPKSSNLFDIPLFDKETKW